MHKANWKAYGSEAPRLNVSEGIPPLVCWPGERIKVEFQVVK